MTSRSQRQASPHRLTVIAISGGTGRTSMEVVHAAMAQFKEVEIEVVAAPRVRDVRAARRVVRSAARQGAVLIHTLVVPRIRDVVRSEAARYHVPVVDVLGPILAVISDRLGSAPLNKPGLSYQVQKERFDRMDSVDFTLSHDDGQGLATLSEADVVLVGPSRVSKSVTCFYLAYRGIRAANVPLIGGCAPPRELLELPRERVIGLTMNAARLHSLRASRLQSWNMDHSHRYGERTDLVKELRFAETLMKRRGWRAIDVSYMAVEEVASAVVDLIDH